MTLKEFLKEVNGKESDIIEYRGAEALRAVKQDGYALQYVKEQNDEICLAAVKQNSCALRYVTEQNDEICLAAVKQNSYALQYVDKRVFEVEEEESQKIKITVEKGGENCVITMKDSKNISVDYIITKVLVPAVQAIDFNKKDSS